MGMPVVIHSDQGHRNFESSMLKQSQEAFEIATTAYHPEGDSMVEWFNCSQLKFGSIGKIIPGFDSTNVS